MIAAGEFALGAVILAAGRSMRMGRSKPLLPWGKTTVIGHLLKQWHALGARQIAVVCAADDQPLQSELERLGIAASAQIHNPTPEKGMFSSIQLAADSKGWRPALTHFAIILADQPHLSPPTLRSLLEQATTYPAQICQLSRAGHGRHPVIFPRASFELLAGSVANDLKEFLSDHPDKLSLLPSTDSALDLDIDRPEDYDLVRTQFGG